MAKTLTKADLRQFTGTETWYRHPLVRSMLYTEGAQYVAETGGAYWLLDEMAFAQKAEPSVATQPFQLWTLKVRDDHTATLTCADGNGTAILEKPIEYTDFPLPEITFYVTDNMILLPSEY
ncbi:MAG: hypothetical protein NW215_00635 [Hyphomicrobiales bacterium]|nr:hypothetical protein [Hyphomicrobiales bacterium]